MSPLYWFLIACLWTTTGICWWQVRQTRKMYKREQRAWATHAEQLRDVENIAKALATNLELDPKESIEAVWYVARLVGWQAYFAEIYAGQHDDDVNEFFNQPDKENP